MKLRYLVSKTGDLVPLPVGSIDDLVSIFKRTDPTGLALARLPITVEK